MKPARGPAPAGPRRVTSHTTDFTKLFWIDVGMNTPQPWLDQAPDHKNFAAAAAAGLLLELAALALLLPMLATQPPPAQIAAPVKITIIAPPAPKPPPPAPKPPPKPVTPPQLRPLPNDFDTSATPRNPPATIRPDSGRIGPKMDRQDDISPAGFVRFPARPDDARCRMALPACNAPAETQENSPTTATAAEIKCV